MNKENVCVYIHIYTCMHTHIHNGVLFRYKNKYKFIVSWMEQEILMFGDTNPDPSFLKVEATYITVTH